MEYKYSIFNNLLNVGDRSLVLYNSYTHHSIIISKAAFPHDVNSLNEAAFEIFKRNGFIVPTNEDETLKVKSVLSKTMAADGAFNLIVNPTLECNCRCWYCYETHAKQMIMSDATLSRLKKFIIEILAEKNELILSFFGGEPFLQFDRIVKPLMEWTKEIVSKSGKAVKYVFTTNSLLIDDRIMSFLEQYDNQSYQITLDGGKECHNRTRVCKNRDSFEAVINAVSQLATHGSKILLRLNLTNDNIKTAFEIPEYFKDLAENVKSNITVACEQVWQDIEKGSIFDDFIELRKEFLKVGIQSALKDRDSIHNTCYADKLNSVVVNYDGVMYKCTAIDFVRHNGIGSIMDDCALKAISSNYETYS